MIIDNLPIREYHNAAPKYLSKTSIRDFAEHGPAWWNMSYLTRTLPKERPDGALQGLALDCYLTEGADAFTSQWCVKPVDMSFATKEGKEWKAAHAGKEILTAVDFAILGDAVAAVRALPCWREIERSKAQQTLRRESQGLGLGIQSRPDWLDTNTGCLWDLKKTRDLSRFGSQAIDLGYHLQAAIAGWVMAGDSVGLEHAYLVAVEWERGARARCYEIPHEVLQAGDKEMRSTAAEIADRLKRNDWTDVQPEPQALEIPDWMLRKMEAV